ncbi:MAG: hypothetical protein Q8S31_09850 [Alphaproteobacteria bacterium]|nr:hypothetical protein [Alphaproteobacteria bacterium]
MYKFFKTSIRFIFILGLISLVLPCQALQDEEIDADGWIHSSLQISFKYGEPRIPFICLIQMKLGTEVFLNPSVESIDVKTPVGWFLNEVRKTKEIMEVKKVVITNVNVESSFMDDRGLPQLRFDCYYKTLPTAEEPLDLKIKKRKQRENSSQNSRLVQRSRICNIS